jgi:class 3 adenylate cyclase
MKANEEGATAPAVPPARALDDGPILDAVAQPADRGHPDDGVRLDRLTLRFADDVFEQAFRQDLFHSVIGSVRAGFLLGIATWAAWGLMVRQFELQSPDLDVFVRFGILIPFLVGGLLVTFLPVAQRIWEAEAVFVVVVNGFVWALYASSIVGTPFDFGYVGVILIMTFGFTLVHLRFVPMAATGTALTVLYALVIVVDGDATRAQIQLSLFYLISFTVLGMIAAYTLERSTRLLFLRERQLEVERGRSEGLLRNIIPAPIAERLKGRPDEEVDEGDGPVLAEHFDEVAVLFADLVGFTQRSAEMPPDQLIDTLDDLFSDMDRLADRHGLEKIKTIGDAYMAVAGVPTPVDDPASRALGMALDVSTVLESRRWPSGEPVRVRIGIALGPVVAGVVGRRKFAYDVWGDTVNLASRLESTGQPGRILVSAELSRRAAERYRFGPVELLELKGKGPQPVCFVLGRVPEAGTSAGAAVTGSAG